MQRQVPSHGSGLRADMLTNPVGNARTSDFQDVFVSFGALPNFRSHEGSSQDWAADNSLGPPPSYFSSPSITTPLLDPGEHGTLNFPRDPSETSVGRHDPRVDTPNSHDHLCYRCDNPKPIQSCGDFTRHLKEHCGEYYCMPENAVKNTEDGPRCTSCEMLNPDPKHLNNHTPSTKLKCFRKHFSRKHSLVKHLKDHHPKKSQVDEDYSTLAEKSKYTGGIKKFACGFCVSGFDSLDEQVRHVHKTHYHRSIPPTGYDKNKVILGLLSMNKHWQKFRTDNPSLKDTSFRWNSSLARELQLRLEMSEEPANDLCKAAFDNCNYGTSQNSYMESVPGTGPTGPQMEINQSTQWFQASQSRLLRHSNLYQAPIAHDQGPSMRPPGQQWASTAQHHVPWSNLDSTRVYGGHRVHGTVLENDDSFPSQYDHPFPRVPSRPSQTWPSRSGLSYDSGLYEPSLGVSSNLTTSTNSRQGTNASTTLEQAQTQGRVPTLASQPWTSSPNHPTVPVIQGNSSFIFANPMQSGGPHSQQFEGHNRRKLDGTSNSNMQRNVQDNADTRRRKIRH